MISTKLAWVMDKRVTSQMEKPPSLSPELSTTITRLTLSLIKVWEKILKLNLDFQQNMINGKKLAMLVWNSISMAEKVKGLVLTWSKTSSTCLHPNKPLNFLSPNLIEVYWRPTTEDYPQAQVTMRLKYKLLNPGCKMPLLLCLKLREMCLFPSMVDFIKI